jgi:hypothetical protein
MRLLIATDIAAKRTQCRRACGLAAGGVTKTGSAVLL